jgi:hypothetical protein
VNETEWHRSETPEKLLAHLSRHGASERKLRLFACACCHRIRHLLADARSWGAVEVAERYADGRATVDELTAARTAALEVDPLGLDEATDAVANAAEDDPDAALGSAILTAERAANAVAEALIHGGVDLDAWRSARQAEAAAQARLVREVFGNPFRRVRAKVPWLRWNDGVVPKLARAIYDERAWERLPVLADELEEAGCGSPAILGHCRPAGEHVRGCWVVDLVLKQG